MYGEEQFKHDINNYLLRINDEVLTITSNLVDSDCCILTEFEHLYQLTSSVQKIAASYYLKKFLSPYTNEYITISLAAQALSEKRHGALIIVQRENPLDDIIHNGVQINGKVSHTLIETIFYPGNPLHDGGALINKDTVVSAGNVLPLSSKYNLNRKIGTRHRAAIGLTERTDALVVVVSEETGRISFAINGELYIVQA